VGEPAWLVLRQDADGELGNAVGEILLEPGLHERIVISVAEQAVTPILFAVLQRDNVEPGVFNFPGLDGLLPYQDANGFRYYPRFEFRTDSGSYLVTEDQPVGSSVTVPYVMAERNVWLLIHRGEAASPDQILGQVALPPGFHWDVQVRLSTEPTAGTLYASLYQDVEEPGVYNFPVADPPLQVGGKTVVAPFQLTD